MNPIQANRDFDLYCKGNLLMIKARKYKIIRRGFTLVELLVVIGIVAVLISIIVPTFINYRNTVSETVCKIND